MKALIVYNEVPDRIRFFILEDPRVDDVLMLENLQGVIINAEDLTEMQEASYDLLQAKVEGSENRIPELTPVADSNLPDGEVAFKDQLKNCVETCQPDRIFVITYLL